MPARPLILTLLVLVGCTGPRETPLEVYAATSLTEAFETLADRFTTAHPGHKVRLHFAGSQTLRLQIEHGAPADVYASANTAHVNALRGSGRLGPSAVFAHNALTLIVAHDDAPDLVTFEDLPRAQRLVIGTSQAPVGRYAREMLGRAATELGPKFETDVLARVVSHESNTRLVRAKIALGAADAAIVYVTDALGFEAARAIAIPPKVNVRATYEMGVIIDTDKGETARRWISFVRSDVGRSVLSAHGFGLP